MTERDVAELRRAYALESITVEQLEALISHVLGGGTLIWDRGVPYAAREVEGSPDPLGFQPLTWEPVEPPEGAPRRPGLHGPDK